MAALNLLGALGNSAPWTAGQYVTLGNGSSAYWNGTVWVAGVVPTPWRAPTVTPATVPITGDSGGTQTTDLDVDFHSTNIPVGGKTATITYNVGTVDVPLTVNLTAGMTPSQAMSAIDAAINAVAELSTSKSGTTITVTPADTVVLSKLDLAIA